MSLQKNSGQQNHAKPIKAHRVFTKKSVRGPEGALLAHHEPSQDQPATRCRLSQAQIASQQPIRADSTATLSKPADKQGSKAATHQNVKHQDKDGRTLPLGSVGCVGGLRMIPEATVCGQQLECRERSTCPRNSLDSPVNLGAVC